MKHLFALLFASFSWLYAPAQNAFLQLFNTQYKALSPLITDSLFVRTQSPYTGETTRAIGFRHMTGLPPAWREVRTQETPRAIWAISQYSEHALNGLITYHDFIDSLKSDTLRSRNISLGKDAAYPDSCVYEIWKNGTWEPIQKTRFVYTGSKKLMQRVEMSWDRSSGLWENTFSSSYKYDGQKRIIEREEQIWQEDAWQVQHSFRYAYRSKETKPQYLAWYADGIPVDSTVTWYDFQGQEDSSKIYQWDLNKSAWGLKSKRKLKEQAAKTALSGDTFFPTGTSSNKWTPKDRREFVLGEVVYTDQPQEELVRTLHPITGEWYDNLRRTIDYQPLQDGRIFGIIRTNELGKDSIWKETFFAEGWFHLAPDTINVDSVKVRSGTVTFSYTCGLFNPYVQNQALTFPVTEATEDFELKIFGEEGRLVFQQRYDSGGLATISAPLFPGLYLVSVSQGGIPLCTQKLMVH